MAIKRNEVKVSLGSYPPILVMGERKVGKTTLMYNLAELEYSLDEMLLISCGDEKGYLALDGIQYEEARFWNKKEDQNGNRGFVQIVDDIVKNNKELGLKMVVIDTLDTLIDIGTEDVLKQHLIEKQSPCKSLNDAFGGFQRGRDRLVDQISKEVDKLDRMGLAVFILAHTKNKDKTDPMSGEKYEMLTNNLRADLYSPIADSCQMIVNIAIERTIEEGVQIGESRQMFFRSNGLIDCGSRFTDMPEKLELSAENFMKAFKHGVESSMRKKPTKDELANKIQNEKEQLSKAHEEIIKEVEEENAPSKEELLEQIKNKMNDSNKKTVITLVKGFGKTKITDLDASQINEILSKM